MDSLFKKLNLPRTRQILVLNAPDTFQPFLDELEDVRVLHRADEKTRVGFAMAFAIKRSELDHASRRLISATEGDAVVWVAYPKKTSKRYKCEFNRDTGWNVLGDAGFEPVRQVAIDEDWSALRFRRTEFIKNLSRDERMAISDEGRRRTRNQE